MDGEAAAGSCARCRPYQPSNKIAGGEKNKNKIARGEAKRVSVGVQKSLPNQEMASLRMQCAACKFLRRKCTPECNFAPYFPPDQTYKFANVHKFFGASSLSKLLNELPVHLREDAVNSLAYEADARVKDPVYGCVGAISHLQGQVRQLQQELNLAHSDLAKYAGAGSKTSVLSFANANQVTPSSSLGSGTNLGKGLKRKQEQQEMTSLYSSPCAACNFLRRKCTEECIFAPHFPPDQPKKFASVHKIFGTGNFTKLLSELPVHQREYAVNSLAYEADARVKDPVYGCVGAISDLQGQVQQLQRELNLAHSDLAKYAGAGSTYQVLSFANASQVTPSSSLGSGMNLSGRNLGKGLKRKQEQQVTTDSQEYYMHMDRSLGPHQQQLTREQLKELARVDGGSYEAGLPALGLTRSLGPLNDSFDAEQEERNREEGKEKSLPLPSVREEFPFRLDVQAAGFSSWDQCCNSCRILVLCDMATSNGEADFIFFHVEGMARVLGIGIPHSKVSIFPDRKMVIVEEMTENLWKTFWMSSYQGPFKAILLESEPETKELSQSLQSNVLHLTKDEALSKLGISMVGPEVQKFVKMSLSESVSQDVEGGVKLFPRWMGLLECANDVAKYAESKELSSQKPTQNFGDQILRSTKTNVIDNAAQASADQIPGGSKPNITEEIDK